MTRTVNVQVPGKTTARIPAKDSASGSSSKSASVKSTSAVFRSGAASLGDFLFWRQMLRKVSATLLCKPAEMHSEKLQKWHRGQGAWQVPKTELRDIKFGARHS